MGYELHITRKPNWFDEDGPDISLAEWKAYVADDPEFTLDGFAEARFPDGTVLRTEDEGIAVWHAYPGHEPQGNKAWFCHFGDRIAVKHPDRAIRRKMHAVARTLRAQVQGDEGEYYGEDGEPILQNAITTEQASSKSAWWKFWR